MKIQPMLELKGIRIELSLAEAQEIARQSIQGADKLQADITRLVEIYDEPEPKLLESASEWNRIDGKHPAAEGKKKLASEVTLRVKCEFCGGKFKVRGLRIHHRTCEARLKVEERDSGIEPRTDFDDPPALGT